MSADNPGVEEFADEFGDLSNVPAAERARIVREALALYRAGWFPMARTPRELAQARRRDPGAEVVQWVQPQERGVIPLDERFHVPRRLRDRVRSGRFVVTSDVAFGRVIRACGEPRPGREETWLHPEIVAIFELLHEAGHAHSIEAWRAGELVGGLYGVSLKSAFFGESMFTRVEVGGANASKLCLLELDRRLAAGGYQLLDSQEENAHMAQFGGVLVDYETYMAELESAVESRTTF